MNTEAALKKQELECQKILGGGREASNCFAGRTMWNLRKNNKI